MEESKMTVIAGFVRTLLILLGALSTIMPMEPCYSEENSKIESKRDLAQSDPGNQIEQTDKQKNKPISEPESESKTKKQSKNEANLSETQNLYSGNKFSHKYHLKGCHFAQIAQPENIFPFASCKEAINSNYLPCNWCLPKWQKFVKGQIIGLPINRSADAKKSSSQ